MLLQFVTSGLTLGSIYGLVALGFAVIYKATEVFNFAQGMLMVCGAYLAVTATASLALPLPLALLFVLAAAAILGVLQNDPAAWLEGEVSDDLRTEVEALLEQRAAARAAKDWPEADRIRDRLNALNVVVMDSPTGATWRVKA